MEKFIKWSILVLILALLLLTIFISPYRIELDLEDKQVNENGLLVLKMFYSIVIALATFYLVKWNKKNWMNITVFVLGAYSLIRIILLFLI